MDSNCQIRIERPFYENKQLREDFSYAKPKKPNAAKQWAQNFRIKKVLISVIPFFGWFFKYNWKKDFLSDMTAGATVAIMHIPQGMAYAMLGNVPAVTGIYMAFFPVLVYFFFGTSRHNSMGAFSIICLMTGKAVLEHTDPVYLRSFLDDNLPTNVSSGAVAVNDVTTGYTPMQVATAVTFTVAIFQILMYFLRFGIVSALLSETLVNAFTAGAGVHVWVSQAKDLLGLSIPKFKGYFVNYYTLKAIFQNILDTNNAALVVSVVTISISAINNEHLKPIIAKISPFPFPMELVAVVAGTLVSKYAYLSENYGVKVVGDIPVGLPEPTVPSFELFSSVWVDGLTIALVAYTINLSMALIFAQKLDYEIDANQEFLAMGAGNLVGSFFSCLPFSASLSRSVIQQVVGGVSQIASVVSCALLLVVLLWIGPFFEPLPKAVLASVIVVALKSLIWQIQDVFKFLNLSKMDALVWAVTFLAVTLIGIDIGLLIGIGMSMLSIFVLSFRPHTCLLGTVTGTDFYLDITSYKEAKEIEGVKIFHYSGGINFATKAIFKSDLIRLVGVNPQKEMVYRTKLAKYLEMTDDKSKLSQALNGKLVKVQNKVNTQIRCLILDFSSVSYIDPSGVTMLKSIIESFTKLSIPVYIAGCKEPVYDMLTKCDPEYCKNSGFRLFPTVYDAHHYANEMFRCRLSPAISTINVP